MKINQNHMDVFYAQLAQFNDCRIAMDKKATHMFVGATVEVTSDFNNQEWGISKPSLKGKHLKVEAAIIVYGNCQLLLEGCEVFIRLEEVILIKIPTPEKEGE